MALGDGNKKAGGKNSRHNFEHRNLLTLGEISKAITTGAGGGATEGTLLSILNNMVASQDVEILLIRDTLAADVVVQQIREYDNGTGLWTTRYENVDGTSYMPVSGGAGLEYLDPSAVLNLVLTELTILNTGTERTPGMLRVTSAGAASVTAGKKSVAVYNYGNADAEWLGQPLLPGERLSWSVEDKTDTLGAFTYNALTSSLLITYKS